VKVALLFSFVFFGTKHGFGVPWLAWDGSWHQSYPTEAMAYRYLFLPPQTVNFVCSTARSFFHARLKIIPSRVTCADWSALVRLWYSVIIFLHFFAKRVVVSLLTRVLPREMYRFNGACAKDVLPWCSVDRSGVASPKFRGAKCLTLGE